MRHIIILASFLHSFLLYYMLRCIVYFFLCTLHSVFICCFCSPSFIRPFTLVHSSPPPISDSGIASIYSSCMNKIMWVMPWMESAVLLVLDGLFSGHGTWKCRSGCPGAYAVRGERGKDSSRGDIVPSRGLVGVRLLDTLSLWVSSSPVCQACIVFFFSHGKSEREKLLLGV